MHQATTEQLSVPASARDVLTEVLREGATRMLAHAIEAEAENWIAAHAHVTDENGHRQVVRNGHLPARKIQTGVGAVEVSQPRVRDRRPIEEREQFSSSILPRYLRKTKSVEELIPWLYHNNAVGVRIGKSRNPKPSAKDCATRCSNALNSGRLVRSPAEACDAEEESGDC